MGAMDDHGRLTDAHDQEALPVTNEAGAPSEPGLVEAAPQAEGSLRSGLANVEPSRAAPLTASPPQPFSTPLLGHLIGAIIYGLATVLVLALGPIILSFIGPDWLVGLAWLIGALTAWRMVGHLQNLAQARVEWAAGAALVIGLTLGLGWAVAAEAGWMPPLLTSGLRPAAPAPTAVPTSAITAFRVGVRVRVVDTGGAGLRVRAGAGVDTAPVGFLPEDAVARIVAGPQFADSFRWWQVEGDGVTGWVADAWLTVE